MHKKPHAGTFWEHRRTGVAYRVVCAAQDATNGREGRYTVTYAPADPAKRGTFFSRDLAEFLDGRFRHKGDGDGLVDLGKMDA